MSEIDGRTRELNPRIHNCKLCGRILSRNAGKCVCVNLREIEQLQGGYRPGQYSNYEE
jgi:hypothetical protein